MLNHTWELLVYLDAMNDLIEDKQELRALGLTEEDLEGYEEFFYMTYFPDTRESV